MSRETYEENLWKEFEAGDIDEIELEIGMDAIAFDTTGYLESEEY